MKMSEAKTLGIMCGVMEKKVLASRNLEEYIILASKRFYDSKHSSSEAVKTELGKTMHLTDNLRDASPRLQAWGYKPQKLLANCRDFG
jgi:hypothetical protein